MNKKFSIVLLGGEGIGPEVVDATALVLERLLPGVNFVRPPHGEAAQSQLGHSMPEITQKACQEGDAILFGAMWKHCAEVIRYLRWGLETYANLRPAKTRPGIKSLLKKEQAIDLLIVRENLEGEYPAREGTLKEFNSHWGEFKDALGRSLPAEGLFALRLSTEEGARRVAKIAVQQAERRNRARESGVREPKITIVTKQNVLKRTDGLFKDTVEQVIKAAGIAFDHYYVDDACRRLVSHPESFDVILTPNLFGDIMSDIAAELVGGLGIAPSGCLGDRYSYFESVHGSAPDIAGKGIANPIATLFSAQMMLEHLQLPEEAHRLEQAVQKLLLEGKILTPDLGGKATTMEVAKAIIALI